MRVASRDTAHEPTKARTASRDAVAVARRLGRRLVAHDAFRSAAAVAFWLFLSLVPLLVLLGFVVGQVARRRGVDALVEPLLAVVPVGASDLVRTEIERLAGSRATLAPLGVLGYLWAASSGVHNLLDVFDRAVGEKARPYWKKRAVSLAWVVGGLAIASVSAIGLVRIGAHGHRHPTVHGPEATSDSARPNAHDHVHPSKDVPHERPRPTDLAANDHETRSAANDHETRPAADGGVLAAIDRAVAGGALLVVASLLLASFFRLCVDRPDGARARVWPGTLASIGCWLAVSWVFEAYAVSIANYALFYGSLAAVAVLLVWLYLTSLSFMIGVELNVLLEETEREAARDAAAATAWLTGDSAD